MNSSTARALLLGGIVLATLNPIPTAIATSTCGSELCAVWEETFKQIQRIHPIFTPTEPEVRVTVATTPPAGSYIDLLTNLVYYYDGERMDLQGASLPPLGYVEVDAHPRGTYPTFFSGGQDLIATRGEPCPHDVCASYIVAVTGSYDVSLRLTVQGVCDPRPRVHEEDIPAAGFPVTFVYGSIRMDRCGAGMATAETFIASTRRAFDTTEYASDSPCADPINCAE